MPLYPHFAERTSLIPGSVYERFRSQFQRHGNSLIRLHIGDTCKHPYYPVPLDSQFTYQYPDYNRYGDTFGVMPLREALTEKLQSDNHIPVSPERILVTGGAVQALNVAVMALVNPGETVMTLTPCWPFFPGIVRLSGARVDEVPFYTILRDQPDTDITGYLEKHLTDNTTVLYLNTPNNPSGVVLSRPQMEAIARFVQKHHLWLISDEAYDGLTYDGAEHISIGSMKDMFLQTVSVFTFSKIFMFAGLRVGYAAAHEEVIRQMNKALVHQLYGPTTFAQYMMIEPLRTRHQWIPAVRSDYSQMRDQVLREACFSLPVPKGTYFFFFDISAYLRGRDYWSVLEQIIDAGVAIAPGKDFGSNYPTYIRICFTGEPFEKISTAIKKINRVLTEPD